MVGGKRYRSDLDEKIIFNNYYNTRQHLHCRTVLASAAAYPDARRPGNPHWAYRGFSAVDGNKKIFKIELPAKLFTGFFYSLDVFCLSWPRIHCEQNVFYLFSQLQNLSPINYYFLISTLSPQKFYFALLIYFILFLTPYLTL